MKPLEFTQTSIESLETLCEKYGQTFRRDFPDYFMWEGVITESKSEIDRIVLALTQIDLRLDIEKEEKGGNYMLSALHPEIKSILGTYGKP